MIQEFVPSCAAPNPMAPGPPGREETALHARAAFQLSRAKIMLYVIMLVLTFCINSTRA